MTPSIKHFNKLLSLSRIKKRLLQVLFDCVSIVICFAFAMALRLDGFDYVYIPRVWDVLIYVIPVTIFVFIRTGLYRAVLRYISSKALRTIFVGIGISGSVMFLADQLFELPVPRSVPFIYMMLLFCFVGGSRFGLRAAYRLTTSRGRENVAIYGAGETGRQLLSALQRSEDYAVIAFLDDNTQIHSQEIDSTRVYPVSALEELQLKRNITTVLIAIPSSSGSQRRKVIENIEKYPVEIRTIPAIEDLVSGRANVSDLQAVEIEDLLAREVVTPQGELMRDHLKEKVVMVTGAGGSIGSELCRQILRQGPKYMILFEVSEFGLYRINKELEEISELLQSETKLIPLLGSVQNHEHLEMVFKTFAVEVIYHAAAYKHVPLVEQNIIEGIRNNILGTLSLVKTAIASDVQSFTLISTDKAVRPTNYMGASKRIAELICQSYARRKNKTTFSMVRFGNVLGSSGSVIPRFTEQIAKGGPVTITHPDITRFFMMITEASQLVIQASAMARGGEIFILDMGKPVRILDLAQRMIRLHGLTPYFEDSKYASDDGGDICIKFTGLRPGEKLYEELLIDENSVGTAHPSIMSANERFFDEEQIDELLRELEEACNTFNFGKIKELFEKNRIDFNPYKDTADSIWLHSAVPNEDN